MIRFLMRPKLALILAWAVTFTGVAAQPAYAGGLPAQLLFVETEQGSINIYSLDNPQAGTVGVITGLAALQAQMAVDRSNDLFVTNNGAYGNYFYVSEFKPPYNKTPVILSTAFGGSTLFPVGVTVNAQGTVFVADCGADCSDASTGILVYPKGATAPAKEITSPLLNSKFNSLESLAIDKQGNVYVLAYNDTTKNADAFEMPVGSTSLKELNLNGLITLEGALTGNGGMAFDTLGNLYVSNPAFSDYVLVFKVGQHNAYRVIHDAFSVPYGQQPLAIAVGPDNNLYVPIYCTTAGTDGSPCPAVYGFKPGASAPFETVGTAAPPVSIESVTTAPNPQL